MSRSNYDVVVLVGAGGHARVLLEALRALGTLPVGYVANERAAGALAGIEYLGDDAALITRGPAGMMLVNAIGSTDVVSRRSAIFGRFSGIGFSFMTVVHPSAILAADIALGEGAQIMAGAVLQPGVKIGCNVIVNTSAVIDHDCDVGDHVHVATGAIVAGGVRIGEASHIGTGATVIQNLTIGCEVLVAAGAVVTEHVAARTRVAGVPARALAGRQ